MCDCENIYFSDEGGIDYYYCSNCDISQIG